MSPEPTASCRRPGRPRNPETHEAILDAALAQLVAAGYQGMSMEAVAERAGTSKATIYRWWTSKEDLLVEALDKRKPVVHLAPTGAPRADLERLLSLMAGRLPPRSESTIARLVGAMADSAELAAMLKTRQGGPGRQAVINLIVQAMGNGELSAELDPELAFDQLVGPIMYRHLVTGDPVTETMAHQLVADLWAAHPPNPEEPS